MGWAFAEFMKNIVFADTVISPLMGGLITGAEFGLGGFGAGFGGAIGAGESIGEAFAAGGLGFASGFGLGFTAGYSYTAGWQNVIHGADIAAHNAQVIEAENRQIANMMRMLDEARAGDGLLGQIETQKLMASYYTHPSPAALARETRLAYLRSKPYKQEFFSLSYTELDITGKGYVYNPDGVVQPTRTLGSLGGVSLNVNIGVLAPSDVTTSSIDVGISRFLGFSWCFTDPDKYPVYGNISINLGLGLGSPVTISGTYPTHYPRWE